MKVMFVGMSNGLIEYSGAHKHCYWEIVLYTQGQGIITIGDKNIEFSPGTIICQPPGVPHMEIADTVFSDIYILVKDFIPPNNEKIPIFFDDVQKRFRNLFYMAFEAYHKKEANYQDFVNSLYNSMHQLLIGWSKSGQPVLNHPVENFRNILLKNITSIDFKISDELKKTGYCSDHFRRCFKKIVGTTPTSYLIDMRIEYAKELLSQQRYTGMQIKEISRLSGFSDNFYFSRIFKNKTGLTPNEYASGMRENLN